MPRRCAALPIEAMPALRFPAPERCAALPDRGLGAGELLLRDLHRLGMADAPLLSDALRFPVEARLGAGELLLRDLHRLGMADAPLLSDALRFPIEARRRTDRRCKRSLRLGFARLERALRLGHRLCMRQSTLLHQTLCFSIDIGLTADKRALGLSLPALELLRSRLHPLLEALIEPLQVELQHPIGLTLRGVMGESALLHELAHGQIPLLHELLDLVLAFLEEPALLAVGLALRLVMGEAALLHELLDAVIARLHEFLRPHAALAGRDPRVGGRDGQRGVNGRRFGCTGGNGRIEQPATVRELAPASSCACEIRRIGVEQRIQPPRHTGEGVALSVAGNGIGRAGRSRSGRRPRHRHPAPSRPRHLRNHRPRLRIRRGGVHRGRHFRRRDGALRRRGEQTAGHECAGVVRDSPTITSHLRGMYRHSAPPARREGRSRIDPRRRYPYSPLVPAIAVYVCSAGEAGKSTQSSKFRGYGYLRAHPG